MKNDTGLQDKTDEEVEILYQGMKKKLAHPEKYKLAEQFVAAMIQAEYLHRRLQKLRICENEESISRRTEGKKSEPDKMSSSSNALLEIVENLKSVLQRLLEPPVPFRA
ncbi:MAG: hypothetical protein ABS85_08630 [Sphingobacteriales bacterium SCN 48-20]|uniref:hypothetical protein n=1 Tax=Terrimonas ferruginea TaxID=249 RepID=UPI00086CE8BD|nr:hypothetical protein [Terrimonas ferruginea]MBN8783154.1 hypothetical protein [Terrimonas ferruginea]ODT92641.1 MAG: hypothetical protein ABS85_08630 [Sphingobacteriales bacterium SCN 48-20]OJW39781.1 MAG: hypothetical protein BGO56_02625 [Sphingobacteriales bacterium 48-107]